MFDEPNESGSIKLIAANEIPTDKTFSYTVTDLYNNCVVASGDATISASGISELQEISLDTTHEPMFIIEWECDGEKYLNHYIPDVRKIDYNTYIDFLNKTNIGHFEGF